MGGQDMGFFSELKEDLSQAVNELIPEEEGEAQQRGALPREDGRHAQLLSQAKEDEIVPSYGQEEAKAPAPAQETAAPAFPVGEIGSGIDTIETAQREQTGGKEMADTLESLLEQMDMQEQPAAPVEPSPAPAINPHAGHSLSDEVAVITVGMTVKGDVSSDGSMDVIGTIEGNIDILGKLNITGTIEGNSKATEIYAENAKISGEVRSEGSVKIGQSSVIIGNNYASSAVIAGAIKGDIDVHGPVILDTSAIVMGNIKSKSVQINNGAVIEGMCSQCYADINPSSFFEEFKKKDKKAK